MAHDPKKKQRLSDFDFSSPDAHVAIVGTAANGKEQFLITKNLNESVEVKKQDFLVNFQDPVEQKALEAAMEAVDEIKEELKGEPVAELKLEDLLTIFFYVWPEDAKKIAESVVMKSADPEKDALRKALLARLQSGSDRSGAAETTVEKTIKTETQETSMSTEKAPEQVELEKALKQVADQNAELADLRKSVAALKEREEAAEVAQYTEVAKGLDVLGAGEAHGKVLKAVAAIEGGKEVIDMLVKAVDMLKKSEKLGETGTGLSNDADDKGAKLAGIAKALAADKGITYQAAFVLAAEQNPQLVG